MQNVRERSVGEKIQIPITQTGVHYRPTMHVVGSFNTTEVIHYTVISYILRLTLYFTDKECDSLL